MHDVPVAGICGNRAVFYPPENLYRNVRHDGVYRVVGLKLPVYPRTLRGGVRTLEVLFREGVYIAQNIRRVFARGGLRRGGLALLKIVASAKGKRSGKRQDKTETIRRFKHGKIKITEH